MGPAAEPSKTHTDTESNACECTHTGPGTEAGSGGGPALGTEPSPVQPRGPGTPAQVDSRPHARPGCTRWDRSEGRGGARQPVASYFLDPGGARRTPGRQGQRLALPSGAGASVRPRAASSLPLEV